MSRAIKCLNVSAPEEMPGDVRSKTDVICMMYSIGQGFFACSYSALNIILSTEQYLFYSVLLVFILL